MDASQKEQPLQFTCGSIAQCIAQRDNYEAIFNSLNEGLAIIGSNRTVTMCNRPFFELTGLRESEVIGKNITALFCKNEACGLNQAILKTIKSGKPVKDETMDLLCADGKKISAVFATSILHDKQSSPSGIVVVFRDVSQVQELQKKLHERYRFHQIIGSNPQMQELYQLIEDVAATDATVLIQGESGTGKELIANALHANSPRAGSPFVKVSCAALSESILESELFGHVKGAFTGAYRDRIGRFEQAHGGSLFLDEIGEIGPSVQVKLLRVLQEREIERVGDTKTRQVDVRIIAATNKDLKHLIQERVFRDDLYYRLKVVTIDVPPLRSRTQDIPLLVEHCIKKFNEKYKKAVTALSRPALHLLMEYAWPGNVRELENAMEHAFVKARTALLIPSDFPQDLRHATEESKKKPDLRAREIDREYLVDMLKRSGGSKNKTARAMGIDRTTLWRYMKKYGLDSLEK